MTISFVLSLLQESVALVMMLSAPMLFAGLVVGFIVALLQTVTSIQEQTLSFVPKAICVLIVLIGVSPWMINTMIGFITRVFARIPAAAN